MSLTPLANAPLLIQFHVFFALIALVLGPIAIHRKSRDRIHKITGYFWVLGMLGVAGTATFIPSFDLAFIGHFGPIHLFVVLTFWSIYRGMRAIYQRDFRAHEAALKGLYWQGLAIAGLFNFIPGRTVNRMLFSHDLQFLGWGIIAAGGLALAYIALRQRQTVQAATA